MSNLTWRISAQSAAGNEDDAALPVWVMGVPFCNRDCAHRGVETCKLTSLTEPRLCEPVVGVMARMLTEGPR